MQFKREKYLKQLIERMHNSEIKVITGIRRCGKSYLLFNLFTEYLRSTGVDDEHIIMLPLDDDINEKYRNPQELSAFLRSKVKNDSATYYILLDEIQFAISK